MIWGGREVYNLKNETIYTVPALRLVWFMNIGGVATAVHARGVYCSVGGKGIWKT